MSEPKQDISKQCSATTEVLQEVMSLARITLDDMIQSKDPQVRDHAIGLLSHFRFISKAIQERKTIRFFPWYEQQ